MMSCGGAHIVIFANCREAAVTFLPVQEEMSSFRRWLLAFLFPLLWLQGTCWAPWPDPIQQGLTP